MTCSQCKKTLAAFIAGELPEKQHEEIESHLAACDECRREHQLLLSLWARLDALPQEAPGEEMRSRFGFMLAAYKEGIQQQKKAKRGRDFIEWLEQWRPRRPAFQLGFALCLLLIGMAAGRWLGISPNGKKEIAQLSQDVQNMRQLVVLSLLQQPSAGERLRGVSLSYEINQPMPKVVSALVAALDDDPNVNVRLAAVDALAPFMDSPGVKQKVIQSLFEQGSPLVQIELINLLIKKEPHQSVQVLERLIEKNQLNEQVKERAEWGIQILS
jgi:hypothetical protein